MEDPNENQVVPDLSKTTSLPALDDRNLTPLVQGPNLPETQSQPDMDMAEVSYSLLPEPLDPNSTMPVPPDVERKLNVLIALLWEFHDWLRQFRPAQELTADQRDEIERRLEVANQVLAVYNENLVKQLPMMGLSRPRIGAFQAKFFSVYAPVTSRAAAILDPKVEVVQVDLEPLRNEFMQPPPPETVTDINHFRGVYEKLEVYESAHAEMASSWRSVMADLVRLGDVRCVAITKDFRDRVVRLVKPPSLGDEQNPFTIARM